MDDGKALESFGDERRKRARGGRSPANPGINLEKAIARARVFYQQERRNAAPLTVAASHWGFGAKSSGGLVVVAALKAFGLMKDVQKGSAGRVVQLTDLALRILLDTRPESLDRDNAIREAALRPRIHAELWKKYGTVEAISNGNLRHYLLFNRKFNENSVDKFITEYKETIAFAKLSDSDSLSEESGDIHHPQEEGPGSEEDSMDSGGVSGETQRGIAGGRGREVENPQISTPVGSEDGQVVFAHVRFDGTLRKEFVTSLKKYLDYLETTLQ